MLRAVTLLTLAASAAGAALLAPDARRADDVEVRLRTIARLPGAEERAERLDALWTELREAEQIPWRSDGTAVFLFRGPRESVAVAGDHNRWNPATGPLTRVEPLDVWLRRTSFPEDARIDYKLVLDGDEWTLDPENEARQWSGFGPNSELAMPAHVGSPWVVAKEDVARGTTSAPKQLSSEHLGREVVYRVHEPAEEHRGDEPLAVLFVTDGHEYLDPRLGALATVHDNLLAAGRIRPVLLVLVDPRRNGRNLRASELAADPRLGRALTEELLPALEEEYELTSRAEERGVLGTSLGGVAAAMICARHRSTIALAAIQSPALWVVPTAFEEIVSADEARPARAFVSWGTVHDGAREARALVDLYERRDVPVTAMERHEGHSWGQWRALLDDALVALFPAKDED